MEITSSGGESYTEAPKATAEVVNANSRLRFRFAEKVNIISINFVFFVRLLFDYGHV